MQATSSLRLTADRIGGRVTYSVFRDNVALCTALHPLEAAETMLRHSIANPLALLEAAEIWGSVELCASGNALSVGAERRTYR